MESIEHDQLVEEMSFLAVEQTPQFLRAIAAHIEGRLAVSQDALATAILDFERGVHTLPELVRMAQEVVG